MENVFDRERLLQANRYFQLSDDKLRDLLSLCNTAGSVEAIRLQAGTLHGVFFHSDIGMQDAMDQWKQDPIIPQELKSGVAALVMISGLDHMREIYRARSIPESIMLDSLTDMTIWMDECRERTGVTGLEEVDWLLHTLRGVIFRLGRLQFKHMELDWNVCVALRRADRVPVAFFRQPENLRGDGQVDGTNGIFDPQHGWQSNFIISDDEIVGTPLHPAGYAVPQGVRLPLADWEISLLPGDGALDLHIPKDGRLEPAQCRDSILSAMEFFSKYFPEKTYKAIHLESWLLDANLQSILLQESNLVRFQREFYLVPELADDRQTYERVFGDVNIDIASAPENTGLQRAVKKHVLEGHHMRSGTGFILTQDMARFGEAQYQTRAARALESMLETPLPTRG